MTVDGGTPPAGFYRVQAALVTTSTGAGNVLLQIAWNDGNGGRAQSITDIFAQIGGTGAISMSIPLYSNGGGISWQLVYTSPGSFSVVITLEKLS